MLYASETNIMLHVNYISIKKKKSMQKQQQQKYLPQIT